VTDYPLLGKLLQSLPANQVPRAFVDVGDRDRPEIIQSAKELSEMLNSFGVPYEWHLFFGYHNEEYWSSHIEQYLRWYAQDW
jgi:enterochelin esterase-like enzyme